MKQYRMRNLDQSGEHFSFNPQEQFDVIRTMRGENQQPVAVYHSHPATPARPSKEDLKLAYDSDISYVIISLVNDEEAVKSFKIRKGKIKPEYIEIVEDRKDRGP